MKPVLIDKRSGAVVEVGAVILRKNYKGFRTRYEVLEIHPPHTVVVRKLLPRDQWVYLTVPVASLQLDFQIC
ncbi:MAG: hypothetical protein EB069_11555 [Actinobacteria bacterium]|nr:hypothetical protein [Actinomycetota bacterium]